MEIETNKKRLALCRLNSIRGLDSILDEVSF